MSKNSVLGTAGTVATTSCLAPLLENGWLRCCFLSNSATKRLQLRILRETCQCWFIASLVKINFETDLSCHKAFRL